MSKKVLIDKEGLIMYHDGIMKEYIKPLQDIVGTSNDGYDVREEVGKVNDRVDEVSSQLEHNTNYINDISINIKKYKSYNKNDGYWDEAVEEALKNNSNIFFPEGTYKFKNYIKLTSYKNINGVNSNLGHGVKFIFENDGFLILPDSRYITIENIQIYGSNKGAGLRYGDVTSSARDTFHFIRIENVQVYGFYEGVSICSNVNGSTNESILWNCFFKNMRIEHCERGLYCYENPYSHFGIVFDCVYFNACNQVLYIRSLQGEFLNCNFGITNINSFNINNNSFISFNGCNFECDELITGKGSIFICSAKNIEFKNSIFIIRGEESVDVFSVYSTLELLSFENVRYSSHNENRITNFWSSSNCETARKGVVQFLSGSHSVPKPTNWGTLYQSRYKDFSNDRMINYSKVNDSHKDHKLKTKGEYAFSLEDNIPIVSDGVNITDFMGNAIGNTSSVHRITNNLYLEMGRLEITTEGLITLYYKHKKKGKLILSPCGYVDGTRKKHMIQIEQSDAYFDKDNYCVLRPFEWDETNKTWTTTITEPFIVDYIKISN